MPNFNSIINKSNIKWNLTKKNIRRPPNVIVRTRPCLPLKANANRNVWYIKWRCIVVNCVVVKIKKVYFGSTQGAFKLRYYNHRTSFSHEKYRHGTSLSNHVWENKKGIDPILKWEIVKRCCTYRAGNKDCMLCNEEKFAIASYSSGDMLNQRSEILNDYKHKRCWILYN